VLDDDGDTVRLDYGAVDTSISLATASLHALLDGGRYARDMPRWLPPFLGGSGAIVVLWVARGVQRLLERRRSWASRLARDLHRWDGRLPEDLDSRARR